MKGLLSQDPFEEIGRPIRCAVELSDQDGDRQGVARIARPDGVSVHLEPQAGKRFSPGSVVQLNSNIAPVGPIRVSARVVSVDDGTDDSGTPVFSAALDFLDLGETEWRQWRIRLAAVRPVVLAAGLDRELVDACRQVTRVEEAAAVDDVVRCFAQQDAAVLVLGPGVEAAASHRIVSLITSQFPANRTTILLIGAEAEPELLQELVDRDRLFYLSKSPVSAIQMRSLVVAAVGRYVENITGNGHALAADVAENDALMDACASLAGQTDMSGAATVLVDAVCGLLRTERARFLLYDPQTEVLSAPDAEAESGDSVSSGLAGFAARTGERIHLQEAGIDPRYDADVDNPHGDGRERFVAWPVFGVGERLIGILTAVRTREAPPFESGELRILDLLVACAAPAMSQILLQTQIDKELRRRTTGVSGAEIFREEALEYKNRGWDQEGDVLRICPPWLTRTHWISVALLAGGLAFMCLARIHEYATGPAVIRARNKIAVTATQEGLVRSVEVSAGDRVRAGDLLVRFQDTPGATTLERFKGQLRAPSDGLVSDVRVRAGQQVSAGDQVASIVDESAGYELISLLPGSYAPQVHPGMPMVLKLDGFPESHEIIPLDRVASEVVGPHEAARYAGRESTDALTVSGPVVIVRAALSSPTFGADGRNYTYQDGMTGQGEVSVRSDLIIINLLPGLKGALQRSK